MIVVDIAKGTDPTIIVEMLQWCQSHCKDSFYFFKQNTQLDEPARFWFEDKIDAFAFRFRYGV